MTDHLTPVTMTIIEMTKVFNEGSAAVENMRRRLQDIADGMQDLGSMGEWVEAKIQICRFNRLVLSQQEYSVAGNVAQEHITDELDTLRTMAHMLKFANVASKPGTELAARAMFERDAERV